MANIPEGFELATPIPEGFELVPVQQGPPETGIADFFTGSERIAATPELGTLPEFAFTDEAGDSSVVLGLLSTFDEKAQKEIIESTIPGVKFETTPDGSTIIEIPTDDGVKRSVLNRPGLSGADFQTLGAQLIAFLPATAFAQFGKSLLAKFGMGALASGATEQALQEGGIALGRKERDPLSTGLTALAGGAGELIGPAAKVFGGKLKDTATNLIDDVAKLRAPDSETGLKQITEAIKTATPEEMAVLVNPDADFFRAVDELNINTEPLASFASQNPQFRSVEQGLASIPASQLDDQSKAFIGELSKKADDLIVEYGGSIDKAALSDVFRQDSLTVIDDLALKADGLYDELAMKIPATTRVEATNTVGFIRGMAEKLGGVDQLSPKLQRVLRQLEVTQSTQVIKKGPTRTTRTNVITGQPIPGKVTVKMPTHERLNQTRKEIGQAINKGTGPFKDQETGMLKALYSRLRQDQDLVAGQFGASDVSEAANGMIRQRKHMEDNLTKLLGKDLDGSILPKVGQALKRLAKGDVQKWDTMMSRIPNPTMRREIVISSLNDVFSGRNVQGQALNPTQFTKFMDDLDRSPATKKRLYKELPKESIQALENLRKVARGISVALQDRIPTGRVAAFFDDNNGMLRRMMGKALTLGVAKVAGPLPGAVTSEFINQTTNGAKSAAAVLASPSFQNIIRTAVRDGVTEGAEISAKLAKAEKLFQKSKVFERWGNSLEDSEAARLGTIGTVRYLLQDNEQQ